jgi:hypothetical protein
VTKVKPFASEKAYLDAQLAACKAYGDGKSIRQIAASSGRSYTTIRRWLLNNGVTMRGRGGPNGFPFHQDLSE